MAFVYILQTETTNSFCVGSTDDLESVLACTYADTAQRHWS